MHETNIKNFGSCQAVFAITDITSLLEVVVKQSNVIRKEQ